MQRRTGRAQERTLLWQNVCNHLSTSRIGSWRICEKDSVSLVSRHPGGRHRNDLLGQCAQCAVHPVVFDGSATAADAAAAVSGDAAFFAADSLGAEPVFEHADFANPVQHAGPILAGSFIAIAFEQHASEQHAGPVRTAAGFASSVIADAFGSAAIFFDSGHDQS